MLDAKRGWRTGLRLLGLLVLVGWQFHSHQRPALAGRGLVLAIAGSVAALSWLLWTWTTWREYDVPWSWDLIPVAAASGVMSVVFEGPWNAMLFIVVFAAGTRNGVPRAFLVTGAAILGVGITWVLDSQHGAGALAYALGLIATTYGGSRRKEALERREQAELLLAQTQRSQEEQLRAARLQESTRIAREIHDVLAHSLAGLTIQLEATVALLEGGADPDTVIERVKRAHALARDGLRETRLAVGALREGSTVVPAATRIDALISDFRAAGNEITLELTGSREQLGDERGDAAVRILQEALTNVSKHAPGAAVSVKLDAGPPLAISVENACPVPVAASTLAHSGGGYGLAGMRERAEELGGSFSAGPVADGWRVEATL
ncbi:MAG: hypothetical protein J2O48_07400 [Solirubrobacterales bacterium]|nr:hypothetical protein [Solirubrobacterales bacterium]